MYLVKFGFDMPPSLREGDREAVEGVIYEKFFTPFVTANATPPSSKRKAIWKVHLNKKRKKLSF